VTRDVLPNGLVVIVQEHRSADVVALQLWIGVGGRDEAPSERGYSHFVEHMVFKGTESRPRGFTDQEVEAVGGRTNAATSNDYTYYYLLLPASRAARGVELLADMAFHASFDPEEIAREREVVFEEVRLSEDNARTTLYRRLQQIAFPGHPYGLPVLGDAAALRASTRDTLRGYYARHYVPDNMALVVVGAVDPAEMRAVAARAFAGAKPAGRTRPLAPPAPALAGAPGAVIARPERQASLGLAWRAPAQGDPDMFAVDLLAQVLGGTRGSRLTQALRERDRIVSSIGAGYSSLQGGGVVTVTAQLEPADEARVEAAILAEIQRIAADGVTGRELERAMTAAESGREFSRETAEGLARAYGRAEITWTLEADRTYLDGIRAVTPDAVRAVARRYLTAPHVRLVLAPAATSP